MSGEAEKHTMEELQKKIGDIEKVTKKYMSGFEKRVKGKPLASAGIIFGAGIVVGAVIGVALSKLVEEIPMMMEQCMEKCKEMMETKKD